MIVSVAVFLLSAIIASGMFFDYKKILSLRWKIFFVILIILGNIALLSQSKQKDKIDQDRWNSSQWREDLRTQDLSNAIKDTKQDEKQKPFDKNIQETPTSFLDMNYQRLKDLLGTNKKIDEQYLTIYFSEVSTIPNFYNLEEWKETENILYKSMRQSLKGYFINRNNYEGHGKTVESEFIKEREKYIKAKEREFNKNK
jgi:CRISPR/Cas system-associated protein Csx1